MPQTPIYIKHTSTICRITEEQRLKNMQLENVTIFLLKCSQKAQVQYQTHDFWKDGEKFLKRQKIQCYHAVLLIEDCYITLILYILTNNSVVTWKIITIISSQSKIKISDWYTEKALELHKDGWLISKYTVITENVYPVFKIRSSNNTYNQTKEIPTHKITIN